MPYSVALLLVGLVATVWVPPGTVAVTSDLILAVLLPGLVFEAAYKLDATELTKTAGVVAVLAIPGVVVTAGVVAIVVSAATGINLALGFCWAPSSPRRTRWRSSRHSSE